MQDIYHPCVGIHMPAINRHEVSFHGNHGKEAQRDEPNNDICCGRSRDEASEITERPQIPLKRKIIGYVGLQVRKIIHIGM